MEQETQTDLVPGAPATTHALACLAKAAVEEWVRRARELPVPADLGEWTARRAGVFVCLKVHGRLRGCIGTFEPTQENVAAETIQNAIASANRDPRFPPLGERELSQVEYTIDVLSLPEKVSGEGELDPKRYGVIVRSGPFRGLLLPDLEGVDTVRAQVDIAKRKAGLSPREPVELYRFTVDRYA